MLTSFVRNHIVPIVFRDVNHRLESERKFNEKTFTILNDEIQELRKRVDSLKQLSLAADRLDEHAKTLAMHTLDIDCHATHIDNLLKRMQTAGHALRNGD